MPFQRLHAEPAAAALERGRRADPRSARRSARSRRSCSSLLDDGADEADAVILAVPHEARRRRSSRRARSTPTALAGLGTSPIVNLHVHYDRRVLDEPLAAALDSPVQWLFDRTAAVGRRARASWSPISLSHAVDEIGASVAELREPLPAGARAPAARRRAAPTCSTSPSRTSRARRSAPRRARSALRPGAADAGPGLYLAGAWTDTGWPATMESAVRSGLAAAAAALAELAPTAPRASRSRPA